jgi:dTDP-4-amino-4,6-dideoxygalactose transaminase
MSIANGIDASGSIPGSSSASAPALEKRPATASQKIPLSRPFLTGLEQRYVQESLASGRLAGDGPFTARVRALLEAQLPARHVLLTTSCTSALELAAVLLKPEPGEPDEVILPSFTFVSTVNAFVLHGFKPIFCDVRVETGNVDAETIAPHLSDRTRLIVPVHYAGVPCDMEPILALASERGIDVVEDAAQALYSRRDGACAGTFGALAAFSFHDTKNFVCGEGGALVVNREDLALRAEIVREKGTNRSQFLLGQVDKYTWVDVGGSFLSSDTLAAMLLAQLEAREEIGRRRADRFVRYLEGLAPLADRGSLALPLIPPEAEPNHHLFFIVLESLAVRTRLMQHLNQLGIGAAFHYPALHTTPMGRKLHEGRGPLPGAEALGERLLRLPLFADLEATEQDRVIDAIGSFFD